MKVHYDVANMSLKCSMPVPKNAVQSLIVFFKFRFQHIILSFLSPTWFRPFKFSIKIVYAILLSEICATCPDHVTLLHITGANTNYKNYHYGITP
jgi:hypothetical protein